MFKHAGLPIAVADAAVEVRGAARHVTKKGGGKGAVREVCELILKAQDSWPNITRETEGKKNRKCPVIIFYKILVYRIKLSLRREISSGIIIATCKNYETTFKISKMDCPSEEQMVRIILKDLDNITKLDFDSPNRVLTVYHNGNYNKNIFSRGKPQ
jgi:hypothetical protein